MEDSTGISFVVYRGEISCDKSPQPACFSPAARPGQKPRFLPADHNKPVDALAESATGDFQPIN
jgi:hypothetical protein